MKNFAALCTPSVIYMYSTLLTMPDFGLDHPLHGCLSYLFLVDFRRARRPSSLFMDQHPPSDLQHGTPSRPEQETGFDPGLLDGGFASPYSIVPSGPVPAPVPQNASSASCRRSDSHCYFSSTVDGAVESVPFIPSLALETSYPTDLPIKSNLTNQTLDPGPDPSPQTTFHVPGSWTGTPPVEWECSNTTFFSSSFPLVANQAMVNEQRAPILQPPSTMIGSTTTPFAPYQQQALRPNNNVGEPQQQRHIYDVSQLTPEPSRVKHRWQIFKSSCSSERVRDGFACWRCRAGHRGVRVPSRWISPKMLTMFAVRY